MITKQSNTFDLQSKFSPSDDQQKVIDKMAQRAEEKEKHQTLVGVTGSGKTFVMANLIKELQKPTLVLSHNKTLAAQLYEEFKEFFPNNAVKYFVSYYDYYQPEAYIPGKDMFIEKEADINQEIERLRLSAMNSVLTRSDTIVIASVSCIYNIGSPGNYENKSLSISLGDEISLSEISRELVFMQYKRDMTDFAPSTFRMKGDVLDIFIPYNDYPVRIEFFGDEVEQISYIDPMTAHKISTMKNVEVFPSKNFVFDKEIIDSAIVEIESDLKDRLDYYRRFGRELEAQRLEQRTMYDIEMLREVGYCKGMENYSVYFEERGSGDPPYTLLDYFPDDYLLFIDESHITIPQVGGMSNGDKARKQTLIDYGFRLPSALDNRPLRFEEFEERQGLSCYFSATPADWELLKSTDTTAELLTRPTGLLDPEVIIRPSENQIDDVLNEVQATIKKNQRILITALTKRMSEDLSSYLKDAGIKVHYLHSDQDTVERVDVLRDLRLGEYDVVVGINLLREGIDLPEVSLVLILDADKEGFLRSKTSLVQTIGRSARHVEGRVILYANKMTDSIKYAVSETKRRREYQNQYNIEHGITPESIQKAIRDKLVERDEEQTEGVDYKEWVRGSAPAKNDIKRVIKELNQKMLFAAENLQFEKAAKLRDQIGELKEELRAI